MSDTRARERITVYSDYVCPFCYLGRQALDRYRGERDERLELDWHPFDLRAGKRGARRGAAGAVAAAGRRGLMGVDSTPPQPIPRRDPHLRR